MQGPSQVELGLPLCFRGPIPTSVPCRRKRMEAEEEVRSGRGLGSRGWG